MRSFLIIVLSVLNTVYGGFVLSKMWAWFILPLFPALPNLPWKYGFGIVGIVILFQYSSASVGSYLAALENGQGKQDERKAAKIALQSAALRFLGYTLTLLISGLWAMLVL